MIHTRVFDTDLRYVVEDVLNEAGDAAVNASIVPGGIDADRNRERPQGVFIIDSNFITESQVRGVNIEPGVQHRRAEMYRTPDP